jgi:hypothetical protein
MKRYIAVEWAKTNASFCSYELLLLNLPAVPPSISLAASKPQIQFQPDGIGCSGCRGPIVNMRAHKLKNKVQYKLQINVTSSKFLSLDGRNSDLWQVAT